jgi:hypothetical protein
MSKLHCIDNFAQGGTLLWPTRYSYLINIEEYSFETAVDRNRLDGNPLADRKKRIAV